MLTNREAGTGSDFRVDLRRGIAACENTGFQKVHGKCCVINIDQEDLINGTKSDLSKKKSTHLIVLEERTKNPADEHFFNVCLRKNRAGNFAKVAVTCKGV